MKTKLFVSGILSETHILTEFCDKNNIFLHSEALIDHSVIAFDSPKDYEVIFFSSIRAFDFFIQQERIPENVKIAVYGEGTAKQIPEEYSIDFIGKKTANPEEIAKQFSNYLQFRKVFFPSSTISNLSIANYLNKEQVEIRAVYQTILLEKKLSENDIYVFTSPSNVTAFLLKNEFPIDCKIIAWGKTTANYLKKRKIKSFLTLEKSTINSLIEVLKTFSYH